MPQNSQISRMCGFRVLRLLNIAALECCGFSVLRFFLLQNLSHTNFFTHPCCCLKKSAVSASSIGKPQKEGGGGRNGCATKEKKTLFLM